ncbi:MAG: histidinol-phosphatase [Kiritimatiellae bacterium]|nr:histidinol-phosphatase [Kiritimatiellia bacterium]
MKFNLHTHCTWCDGKNSPEEMILSAIAKNFSVLGFSSHAMLPEEDTDWVLTPEKAIRYVQEIRALSLRYADQIQILCGAEADYVPGGANPDRKTYAHLELDYLIGSVHFVVASDGVRVAADHTPELLEAGIRDHFANSPQTFLHAYFEQQCEMVRNFDFDIVGHPDLCRKFNGVLRYFDEQSEWYREELRKTADAIAESGKIVEVNTGAISRGWMDDAYPSAEFRTLLRERGVRFILSSDAHAADQIDCAFERFEPLESYISKLR